MHEFNIKIANFVVSFNLEDEKFYQMMDKRYGSFRTYRQTRRKILLNFIPRQKHKEIIDPYFQITNDKVIFKRHDFEAEKKINSNTLTVRIEKNKYTFDTFLRVYLSYELLQRRCVLIHAAGFYIDYKHGILVPGQIGAGKTTLSKKAKRDSVLSDEIICIVSREKFIKICGTPFMGNFRIGGSSYEQQLMGCYFLLHKGKQLCEKLSYRDSLVHLMKNIIFFGKDISSFNTILKICINIVTKTPCYSFGFTLNESFDKILKRIGCSTN